MKDDTRLTHGFRGADPVTGAISFPIFQSATFRHNGLNQSTGYDYSRAGNPTRDMAVHILGSLKLIYFAESLGGVESLLTYPYSQTHAQTPCELKEKVGLDDCLLRLSVGIEDVSDLIEDLTQALESCDVTNDGGQVL